MGKQWLIQRFWQCAYYVARVMRLWWEWKLSRRRAEICRLEKEIERRGSLR